MLKFKTICFNLVILSFINSAYAADTKVICPTNVVWKNNQCDPAVLVSPWVKAYPTSDPQPDGTYNFIRADVYRTSNSQYSTTCWLEDSFGHSIVISSKPNNVYPDKGGLWTQLACTDFAGKNPRKCPLIWEHH